jgi:hypothetical protein
MQPVSKQRLDRQVPAETKAPHNRRAVFSMWSTRLNNGDVVFSAWSVPRGYETDREHRLSGLSFETPACQDMSLGAEELNWGVEASEYWVQFSVVESMAVTRRLCVCYRPTIFGVCNSGDCYSSCVKIRCHETDSGDYNRRRTPVCVRVKCEVWIRDSDIIKCSYDLQEFNKPNYRSKPRV